MISKIEVWGDSILRDVVLDPATRRYSRLKEASCVALSSRALGIPAENLSLIHISEPTRH